MIARHDVGAISGPHRAAALQTARDAARGRLVAFGAGLFAAGALVYTARNFSLARQGQVTDRYTKAIEQLGSEKGLDVRIGGIYALERIARDSARDHPTIMEVLAAFIRDHSREDWTVAEPGFPGPLRATRPDIQAAATVIGRRTIKYDSQPINLQAANLTRANLTRANLAGANLAGAILTFADLTHADLTHADLTRANLTDAHFPYANLHFANLTDALIGHAILAGANLTGANFVHEIADADVSSADLARVDLTGANLTRTLWPWDTTPPLPKGWQRDTDSGRLKRDESNSGDAAAE